jgi:hypothetical protein
MQVTLNYSGHTPHTETNLAAAVGTATTGRMIKTVLSFALNILYQEGKTSRCLNLSIYTLDHCMDS